MDASRGRVAYLPSSPHVASRLSLLPPHLRLSQQSCVSESVHALSPLFLHLLCCLSTLAALPLPLLQRTPVPVSSSACAVVSTGLALPSPVVGIPFSGLRGRRFRVRRRLVPHTPRARLSSRPVRLGLRRLCADAAPLVVGRAPPRPAAHPLARPRAPVRNSRRRPARLPAAGDTR